MRQAMLLIGIRHGGPLADSFTCSTPVSEKEIDHTSPKDVVAYLCKTRKIKPQDLDQVLVLEEHRLGVEFLHNYVRGEDFLLAKERVIKTTKKNLSQKDKV
jgi:hypothetical protein